jgi:hypothetical protein
LDQGEARWGPAPGCAIGKTGGQFLPLLLNLGVVNAPCGQLLVDWAPVTDLTIDLVLYIGRVLPLLGRMGGGMRGVLLLQELPLKFGKCLHLGIAHQVGERGPGLAFSFVVDFGSIY